MFYEDSKPAFSAQLLVLPILSSNPPGASCETWGMWMQGSDADEHLVPQAGTLSTQLWHKLPPAPPSMCRNFHAFVSRGG